MTEISKHNRFYLAEDRRLQPKEYFKLLVRLASERLAIQGVRILDIGCATGEFLFYLRSLYPTASLSGVDIEPDFVAQAKKTVPDAHYFVGDVQSGFDGEVTLPYDLVFMSSVHYLFPEYKLWLRNLVSVTRGAAYVFGVFNPEDLDVRAVVQRSGDETSSTPWNLISQRSVSGFLDNLQILHRFVNWQLPIEIERSREDSIRSWTIETKNGDFLVVNGTQLLHRLAVLEIIQNKPR